MGWTDWSKEKRWGIQRGEQRTKHTMQNIVPSNIQAATGPGLENWALERCSAQGGTFKGSRWTLETEPPSPSWPRVSTNGTHCWSRQGLKSLSLPKIIRSASMCGSPPRSPPCQLLQTPSPYPALAPRLFLGAPAGINLPHLHTPVLSPFCLCRWS